MALMDPRGVRVLLRRFHRAPPIVVWLLACAPPGTPHADSAVTARPTPPSASPTSDASSDLATSTTADAALRGSTPNPNGCDAWFGPDGEPRATAHALASVQSWGMGGGSRFEIVDPRLGRYVEHSYGEGRRSCFQAELSVASMESLRRALVANDFCKLQALAAGSRKTAPTDAGWIKLEAHLPGVSCVVEFAPYQAESAATDADSWTASLRPPFRAVFEAFDRLERDVQVPDAGLP